MDDVTFTLSIFSIALLFFTIASIAWVKRDYIKERANKRIAQKNNLANYFSCVILIANESKEQYVFNGILGINETKLIFAGHNPNPITIANVNECKFEELSDFDSEVLNKYLSSFNYKSDEKIKYVLEGIESRKKLPKSITKRKTLIINISDGKPVLCFVENKPENVKRVREIQEILFES
ncbi:MAG: hypothetical protein FWG70_01280 [Oscillospiraceae bacterium]|nr:hypothetical protein [Oscillospiraceae bacterium]